MHVATKRRKVADVGVVPMVCVRQLDSCSSCQDHCILNPIIQVN